VPFGLGRKKEPTQPQPQDEAAPGWDAIDRTLSRAFPGQTPLHWGTDRLPGQDGIYGLSAYRDGRDWFFVTYGLSELFAKESDDPTTSGFGFELTLRVPALGDAPPSWARVLLDRLGSHIFTSGSALGAGHRIDLGAPITGGNPPSRLTAAAFAVDPVLGSIDTPNGALTFLTLVGLTADELARMKATSTAAVVSEMARTNPHLVTDPAR
jgi:hypothetical protein